MCAAREGIGKHTSPTASGVFSSFEVCQRPPVCSLLDSRRPHAEAESAPTSASHPDRSASPIWLPTLRGRLEVNSVLGMKLWGIVLNEKAKLHWLPANDGTEVRVDAPKCICFLTPALVAGGYDPLGLHGTEVHVRSPKCIYFVNPALVADGDDPVGLHGTVVSGMATVPGATVPEKQSCLKCLIREVLDSERDLCPGCPGTGRGCISISSSAIRGPVVRTYGSNRFSRPHQPQVAPALYQRTQRLQQRTRERLSVFA